MSSDIHALSGAYAVDALDDIERAQFERHLAECDTCRSEVDSLLEASGVLAEAVFLAPPAALRDRVLAGIETVRPLPPVVTNVVSLDTVRRKRRFPALVAAAAVVTLIGAGVAVTQPWQDETTQITLSAADRVLQAPDAETWTKSPVTGGTIKVTRSRSLNQAVVEAKGLATLPDGKTYALWLQHDGVMIPAGLLSGEGTLPVVLEGDPGSAEATAVSIEPASGSLHPTTFPIATFEFEQV
ncbi:anti-sigma factor [Nocardioides sp.]|uniref:anti-sigma factor n=1 Tax=Nocardioides sp. TaxID=35761 RepID=UPI00286C6F5A|nr:anti-sigma factor [Nocardioides sp.]